jgi:hypothetical protein
MYTTTNFPSKKALKDAVAAGKKIGVYSPGLGEPPTNGTCSVEGPWYPKAHTWYAQVVIIDEVIAKVK